MKILFIGGTGTISSAITRQLAETNNELYLLNRGNNNASLPKNVRVITADINNEADVKAKLQGLTFDSVCDFIGFVPEHVERDFRIFNGKTKQYIYISSASAYAKPVRSHIITEGTSLVNPYWEYSRNKIACERFLMDKYRYEEPHLLQKIDAIGIARFEGQFSSPKTNDGRQAGNHPRRRK